METSQETGFVKGVQDTCSIACSVLSVLFMASLLGFVSEKVKSERSHREGLSGYKAGYKDGFADGATQAHSTQE